MNNSYDVAAYKSPQPVTLTPKTDIFDAIHELLSKKVSGATVVDENNKVVGVLSELDCLQAIINLSYYHQGGSCAVEEFMTTGDIDYIDENVSIIDAAQALLKTKRRRMPVISDGKFAGQISARSVLQAFKDEVMEHDKSEDETTL